MTAPAAVSRRHVSSGSGPGKTMSPATRSLWKRASLGRREDGARGRRGDRGCRRCRGAAWRNACVDPAEDSAGGRSGHAGVHELWRDSRARAAASVPSAQTASATPARSSRDEALDRRACARRASCPSSIARTSAVPTTTPSACRAASRAFSRESIPKPTTTGSPSSAPQARRPASPAARGVAARRSRSRRSPTRSRRTASRPSAAASPTAATRSALLVGASSGTTPRPRGSRPRAQLGALFDGQVDDEQRVDAGLRRVARRRAPRRATKSGL